MIYSITKKLQSSETSPLFCNAGVSSFTIDSKGNLFPCHLMMDNDCHLENIYKSNASLESIAKKANFLKKFTKEKLTKCQLCWYEPFCKGCPAQMRNNNNTISDDVCAYKKDKAELLLLYYVNIRPQERDKLLHDIIYILNEGGNR